MKRSSYLLMVALLFIYSWISPGAAEGSSGNSDPWHSYEDGLKIAGEENRSVIMDFRQLDCPSCDDLDKITFGNASVLALQDRYVFVKVNLSDPGTDYIAQRYNKADIKVLGIKLMTVDRIMATPYAASTATGCHRTSNPYPLIKMPRAMGTK